MASALLRAAVNNAELAKIFIEGVLTGIKIFPIFQPNRRLTFFSQIFK